MSFHFLSLFRKPAHTEVRYVAATASERRKADRKRKGVELQLAVAVSRLTPEQAQDARMRAGRRR